MFEFLNDKGTVPRWRTHVAHAMTAPAAALLLQSWGLVGWLRDPLLWMAVAATVTAGIVEWKQQRPDKEGRRHNSARTSTMDFWTYQSLWVVFVGSRGGLLLGTAVLLSWFAIYLALFRWSVQK